MVLLSLVWIEHSYLFSSGSSTYTLDRFFLKRSNLLLSLLLLFLDEKFHFSHFLKSLTKVISLYNLEKAVFFSLEVLCTISFTQQYGLLCFWGGFKLQVVHPSELETKSEKTTFKTETSKI